MRMWPAVVAIAMMGSAGQAEREFCPDRPGEGTPACTMEPGSLQIETSLADYSHSRDADEIENETLIGDTLLRYGVADHAELRFGWTAYGFDRTRDRADGSIDRRHGTGDITLGFRRNLQNPDGNGISFALQPFVTLPVGHAPIGAETWSAGLLAPIVADLGGDWQLTLDPEVDAAADEERHGRHLAYSGVLDLQRKLGKNLSITGEGFVQRDDDPGGHETRASADVLVAYQIGENSQVDFSVYRGLNSNTPRVELIAGLAHRF